MCKKETMVREGFLECNCCFKNGVGGITSQWEGLFTTLLSNSKEAAMHQACYEGNEEAVSRLLYNKTDPNCLNTKKTNGFTPLHCAAWNGQKEVIQILLQHGADKTLQDNQGRTPYEIAIELKRQDCLELLKI